MDGHGPTHAPSRSVLRDVAREIVRGDDAFYRLCFAVCAVFTIWPLWAGAVLPFQDYAGNMTYAAILAGALEEGSTYDRIFHTGGLLLPNGLLFWSWAGLGEWLGYISGGKVLLSLYAVGLPLSVDRLLVATGRDRRFALLTFPLVFNSNLMMGFVSYATSLPLAVYAMARAWRFLARPAWGRGLAVAALAMLTFLGHVQMYLVLGIMALAFVVFAPRTLRGLLLSCAAFAPSLLLFLPWAWREFVAPPDPTALGGRDLVPFYPPPEDLFSRWDDYAFSRWSGDFDDWVFLGTLAVFALGLLARRADRLPGEGRARFAPEAMTLAVVVAYLSIPEHTVIQAAIGSRLVAVAMAVAVTWLHMPRARWMQNLLVAGMATLAVTHGWYAAAAVDAYDREEIGPHFLEMVEDLPDGSRLAVIVEDRSTSYVKVHPHDHVYGYHYGLNQGVAYSTFHSFYGRHAWWRDGRQVPWPGRDPRAFLRSKTACWYDYLLVRTAEPPRWRHLGERVTYRAHSRKYTLWTLEHDRIPACREPEPEPGEEVEGGARREAEADEQPRLPLAATASPEVGHARGRSFDGDWAPADRARRREQAARALRVREERRRRDERRDEQEEGREDER
ncbi:MAG: hypothetical protein ACQEXJ_17655 [Myxococcota bacterium]